MAFAILIFPLFCFASGAELIQGKWRAQKYLGYGVENGKEVPLKVVLKPRHFGMFMYLPDQTLEITILESNKQDEAGKIPGKLRSDKSLLDPACSQVSDYASYSGCKTTPNTDLSFAFRFFAIDTNPSRNEKAMISAWKKSGLSGITDGFNATAADLSSHVGFVGKDHLILRVNYFKNPLRNAEDAFASKCPKRNRCYTAFLRFDRVPDPQPAK